MWKEYFCQDEREELDFLQAYVAVRDLNLKGCQSDRYQQRLIVACLMVYALLISFLFLLDNGILSLLRNLLPREKARVHRAPPALAQYINHPLECEICMEDKKEIALSCGHVYCAHCASGFNQCPTCRKYIFSRKRIFL